MAVAWKPALQICSVNNTILAIYVAILTILLCILTKTTVGTRMRACVCTYVHVERESGIAMVQC